MKNRRILERLLRQVEQASYLQALLVLIMLLILRAYRSLTRPDRRASTIQAHWVNERRRPLRPVHLLPGVILAVVANLAFATHLPQAQAIYQFGIGNLVIIAVAMLPSIWQAGNLKGKIR
jgi:ABC-type Fe3+ transport system permease subunit